MMQRMLGIRTLLYSLIVHSFLVLLLYLSLDNYSTEIDQRLKSQWVEMEILSLKNQQLVMEAEAPNLSLDHSQTNLKSKEWQRVEKQQRARKSGTTANRSQIKRSQLDYKKTQKVLDLQPKFESQQQASKKPETSPLNTPIRFHQIGSSSFGERVSDLIDIGEFTALNTDPHKFYSFHSRINDRIRIRWVNNIENSIRFFKQTGLTNKIPKGEWVSTIDIILNKSGYFEKALLKKSSGIKAWDQAAIRAFRNGSPYLNPPTAIVEKDGKIRLTYSFSVKWDPSIAHRIN